MSRCVIRCEWSGGCVIDIHSSTFIHVLGEAGEDAGSGRGVEEIHGAAEDFVEQQIMELGGGSQCPLQDSQGISNYVLTQSSQCRCNLHHLTLTKATPRTTLKSSITTIEVA